MCKYQIVKIMMDWKRLISAKRFGMEEFHEERQKTVRSFSGTMTVLSSPPLSEGFRTKPRFFPFRAVFLFTTD